LHREMIKLKAERTAQCNSIKGLLAGLGLCVIVDETLPAQFGECSAVGWRQAAAAPATLA